MEIGASQHPLSVSEIPGNLLYFGTWNISSTGITVLYSKIRYTYKENEIYGPKKKGSSFSNREKVSYYRMESEIVEHVNDNYSHSATYVEEHD